MPHLRIGKLRAYEDSEVKHIQHSEDTRALRPGDIIQNFDHICEWDEDCISFDVCESWRGLGDASCDKALRDVFSGPSSSVGKDLLKTLEEHASARSDTSNAAQDFLDEMNQAPPAGILASEEEIVLAQNFFLDNSIQIMQALLHYSLAGGFASPRIVRTLEAVSYLVPHVQHGKGGSSSSDILADVLSNISKASTDRTFARLSETMQFILDVMGCTASALPAHPASEHDATRHADHKETLIENPDALAYLMPGGDGWRSTVRVRLLHGIARWRVEDRWSREGNAQPGIPISQEDMAATLAAFSTVPIWSLHRLALPPSPAEASAYLALWRHVGYYLGVSPPILLRHFRNTHTADKFLATAALHLFSDDPSPSSPTSPTRTALRGPTIPILVAVSNRAPLHTSLFYNIALTTHLLGPALSAHLGLPRAPLAARLRMHAFLLLQRVPHAFARWYPRAGWRAKRRAVLREGMVRSVWWNMGLRRTTFRPRTMVRDTGEANGDGEGEGGAGGELAPGVVEEEGIQRDPVRGKMLTRMWSEVWKEMIAVCVIVGAVASFVSFIGLRFILRSVW
ncbi:hypothetical protein TRAPUB_825 [Trametes pubescens]|uniref:ER-bound oxygenase mpaB/mpaB'/Rubber oxygenase catalytic domain-containing protein n=1 Tax=Trametes pubescens TaxID=154538 RepID=A0A1M2VL53_TRAPU|nr:hypothetical protein TRAPUB_825 [Trametes pubescens]